MATVLRQQEPQIFITDGHLRIDGWETTIPQIIHFFEEKQHEGRENEFPSLLEQALTAGIIAFRAVGVGTSIDQVEREFEDLSRVAVERARAEAQEKGAQKGRNYQDLVFHALNEIAKVFGDTAELIADRPGLEGKEGDIIVTLHARDTGGVLVRLVVEAKDGPVGERPVRRELDTAMIQWGAAAAIAVYSREEYMPKGTTPLAERDANSYLCLYDKDIPHDSLSLRLAYRVARILTLEALRPNEERPDWRPA